MGVLLLAGTRKGLFLLHGDETRESWELEGPLLTGWSVFHALRDPGDGSLQVAANSFVYGGTFQRSNDDGKTWQRAEGLGLPEDSGLVLEEPTRERWQPGAGGMCCHSIQLDPSDPNRMYIAISAAGTFRTDDGGKSWAPKNQGVAADFFPEPDNFPEVGQCVHKLLLHPDRPERLWQQNHCGVYRTADGGASWKLVSDGLPEPAWGAVMREGLSYDRLDPPGVYFGTQSGSIFASTDGGWTEVARQLPPILSVEAAAWS